MGAEDGTPRGLLRAGPVVFIVACGLSLWLHRELVAAWPHGRVWEPTLRDADQFIWSMEAIPARLRSFDNPFFTDDMFVRTGGANLAYNTAAPGVAIAAMPVTWLFGPTAALIVVTLLIPPLAAWAAHHLCTVVAPTAAVWTRIIAALLIGFCPSVVLRNGHHVNLAAAVPVVLVGGALAVQITRSIAHRQAVHARTALLLGVVAGSMVWVSTELLALSVLAVTTPAVVLLAIERTRPSVVLDRCRHAWRALAIAAAAALVVSLPFWSQFVGGSEKVPELYHDRQQHLFGLRLDNLFVPIDSAWPRRLVGLGLDGDLGPLPAEAVGYLSIAGVAAACVVTVAHRSGDRRLRFAILGFWCSLILGLGRSFNAGDGHWGWLPWRIVDRLPLIGDAIPNRLALFTFLYLVVALLLVVDLPATPRLARWGKALIVAMAVFVVPVMPFDVERLDVEVADAIVATCADADVLVVPRDLGFGVFVGPRSMAWQAEAGMRFGLIRGWAFRESSPAEGPPFALDQLVGDDGRGSVERASEELEALAPVCVVAPEAGDDALQRTIQQPPVVQSGWRIWHVK